MSIIFVLNVEQFIKVFKICDENTSWKKSMNNFRMVPEYDILTINDKECPY